jgi:hypothetical protein
LCLIHAKRKETAAIRINMNVLAPPSVTANLMPAASERKPVAHQIISLTGSYSSFLGK